MPSVIHIKSSIVKSQARPSLQRSVMSLLLLHTVPLLVSAFFAFAYEGDGADDRDHSNRVL